MSTIIETELKEFLGKLEDKIDKKFEEVNQKLNRIDERLNRLEIGQGRLEEKVDSIDKRIEKVETSQKNQIWALIGILGTALVGTIIRFVITALPGGNP